MLTARDSDVEDLATRETEIVGRLKRLYTPAISDTLDEMGITSNVLSKDIRPLLPGVVLAGPAITGKALRYREYTKIDIHEWVKVMLRMLESARRGQVFVVQTEDSSDIACWGELMSNAARARGAAGAVTDGGVRDTPKILHMKPRFHVFAASRSPLDAKGRMEYRAFNVPVNCGGVLVNPGDFVVGDDDGVVIVPKEKILDVLKVAETRARKEDAFRKAVRRGEKVSIVFRRYGIF